MLWRRRDQQHGLTGGKITDRVGGCEFRRQRNARQNMVFSRFVR